MTSGGSKGAPPPPLRSKMFSFSCSFSEIFGKVIGWRPLPGGLAPLLRRILDPPLMTVNTSSQAVRQTDSFETRDKRTILQE